jgi:hydroxypyruvate isomerase
MFNELGFLERFAAARAAGFDAVEFLFPYAFEPEQILGRLQRYRLQLVLHNFPPGDWVAGERGVWAARMDPWKLIGSGAGGV